MRPALFILLFFTPLLVSAQYQWADCVDTTTYSYKAPGSNWQAIAGKIRFCYDTHAFEFTAGRQHWFTGIESYSQHLEDGILIEDFISEPHAPAGSELRFHIRRSAPAVITITHTATGRSWLIRSASLSEVKLRSPE